MATTTTKHTAAAVRAELERRGELNQCELAFLLGITRALEIIPTPKRSQWYAHARQSFLAQFFWSPPDWAIAQAIDDTFCGFVFADDNGQRHDQITINGYYLRDYRNPDYEVPCRECGDLCGKPTEAQWNSLTHNPATCAECCGK